MSDPVIEPVEVGNLFPYYLQGGAKKIPGNLNQGSNLFPNSEKSYYHLITEIYFHIIYKVLYIRGGAVCGFFPSTVSQGLQDLISADSGAMTDVIV